MTPKEQLPSCVSVYRVSQKAHMHGRGLPFMQFGPPIRYSKNAVIRWIQGNCSSDKHLRNSIDLHHQKQSESEDVGAKRHSMSGNILLAYS